MSRLSHSAPSIGLAGGLHLWIIVGQNFLYASQLDYVSGWAGQRIGANEAPLGECLRENKFLAVRFIMQLGFAYYHSGCTLFVLNVLGESRTSDTERMSSF